MFCILLVCFKTRTFLWLESQNMTFFSLKKHDLNHNLKLKKIQCWKCLLIYKTTMFNCVYTLLFIFNLLQIPDCVQKPLEKHWELWNFDGIRDKLLWSGLSEEHQLHKVCQALVHRSRCAQHNLQLPAAADSRVPRPQRHHDEGNWCQVGSDKRKSK